jgi:hypothetical protein
MTTQVALIALVFTVTMLLVVCVLQRRLMLAYHTASTYWRIAYEIEHERAIHYRTTLERLATEDYYRGNAAKLRLDARCALSVMEDTRHG